MKRGTLGVIGGLVLLAAAFGVFVGNAYGKTTVEQVNLDPSYGALKGMRGTDFVFENQVTHQIYVVELWAHEDDKGKRVVTPRVVVSITRDEAKR